ncbi:MAG: SPOR domain-containing protein [Burkholderiaceae bacterium]|nr:SPOR domain-containing protein [Burkholderiaceae bacterium]
MPLAFWRRDSDPPDAAKVRAPRRSASATSSTADEETGRSDADNVRVRARRRLIGAAALLLAVAIVVPMTLDPEPKLVADNVAIDIPSEKTPFTPRLSLPPVPAPENVPVAPPPDSASPPGKADEAPKATEASKVVENPSADGKKTEEQQRARALLEGKASAKPTAPGKAERFAVQAAAPASEASARDLADRLKKGGLAPYMEKVDTSQGARYRVRLGPYASRDEADGVRNRLKAQGISANLITL